MSEQIFLRDLEGETPKVNLKTVLDGASEFYDDFIATVSNCIPSIKDEYFDFKKSHLKKHIEHLAPYVCHHKYELKDAKFAPSGSELPENLIHSVNTVYEFWRRQVYEESMIFNELSTNQRYFSLFARAAKCRFQIDYNAPSDHRAPDENYEDACYFLSGDLALLCSINLYNDDWDKALTSNKILVEPKFSTIKGISSINFPKHREFDGFAKGRKSGGKPPKVLYQENAKEWLSHETVPYTPTNFVIKP
ncbi:hypothetical protein ACJJID_19450 [Microbulbifer sp. CnH-101-G]|uniref:hypothetical protein n=1 Tax=Microbulbifer sp. CnH-101-G TaxID=3243393 RepID=UPI0040398D12